MAKQFLKAAQICPARKQMRGEAVAERMRCGPCRQPQSSPRHTHRAADDRRTEWPAARAPEQDFVTGESVRAKLAIGFDG